jgi:hypothetical protein
LAQAVRHEVKRAVGRYKRDRAVVVKAREPHALVELDVLEVDRLLAVAAALRLKQHLR